VGNAVNVFMNSGWHTYRKGIARSATNDTLSLPWSPPLQRRFSGEVFKTQERLRLL